MPKTDNQAKCERDCNRRAQRKVKHATGVGCHHRRSCNGGPERKVDVARNHHHHRPGRENSGDGNLAAEVGQVARAEEQPVRQQLQNHPHRNQHDDHGQQSELPLRHQAGDQVRPRAPFSHGSCQCFVKGGGHAGSLFFPEACNITSSSVASPRLNSLTIRPSHITRTRSAMPSTSGRSVETRITA